MEDLKQEPEREEEAGEQKGIEMAQDFEGEMRELPHDPQGDDEEEERQPEARSRIFRTLPDLPHAPGSSARSRIFRTLPDLPHAPRSSARSRTFRTLPDLPHAPGSSARSRIFRTLPLQRSPRPATSRAAEVVARCPVTMYAFSH